MATKGKTYPSKDTRAKAVLESVTLGDEAVCQKYSISTRTLQRWREKLKTGSDKELTESVAAKKRALDQAWGDKVPGCLSACVDFISQAAKQANRKDPDVIHSVAGAMKLVAEVAMSWKMIDARVSGQGGPNAAQAGSVPSSSNVTPIRRTG